MTHDTRTGSAGQMLINILASVAILVVGGVTLIVFGQKPEIETKTDQATDRSALVQTSEVELYEEPFELEITGEASSYRVLTIGTEVAGTIREKSPKARSGFIVRRGDRLFQIDDESYQIEVDRRQAELDQIDQEVRTLNIEMDNQSTLIALADEEVELQRRNLDRVQSLRQQNAAKDAELDSAKLTELASRNALRRLQNELSSLTQQKLTKDAMRKVAETALARAQLDLKRCEITSPIDGTIVDEIAEAGDHVTVGEELVHISENRRMQVNCQVKVDELEWIWQQQISMSRQEKGATVSPNLADFRPIPCEVVYDSQGVKTVWQGVLSRFEGTGMNRETRTIPCRVVVDEPTVTKVEKTDKLLNVITPPALISGMFVSVRIPIQLSEPLLKMPSEAVRPGNTVWVNRENELQILDVSIAQNLGDAVLIKPTNSHLQAGDKVIVSPLTAVQQGMAIRESESAQERADTNQAESGPESELST